MRHFGVETPMTSHHKFNEHESLAPVMARLEAGEDIALVSDAGTPGISDPGFMLSRECRRLDIPVVTLPGPTAFVPALVSSGLPCDRFVFEGFLPPKKGRATRMAELAEYDFTTVVYESPLRLVRTLTELAEVCGEERAAAVVREISKIHENCHRGTLGGLRDYFATNQARGEIVIIIAGKDRVKSHIHRNKYRTTDE